MIGNTSLNMFCCEDITQTENYDKAIEETRRKISESRKGIDLGKHWFTDGRRNRAFECPPGFVRGKTHHKQREVQKK